MRQFWLIGFAVVASVALAYGEENVETRQKRSPLGVFSIVRFPNDACEGTGNKNGTCYTPEECENKGGTNSGTCASGYGTCCTFSGNCGATFSENCTYFESSGSEIGGCKFEVCKCQSNICQLRLDFDQFVITGPSTDSVTSSKINNGQVATYGVPVTHATQCLTDTFTATNPGGNYPSQICGMNSGEHMYLDASDSCNDLVFQLGQNAIGASQANRQWSIKVTQYACDYENLAPKGCTQYFFGETVDTVRTYNYAGGQHLADQDQAICVRQEEGNCRICWSAMIPTDFAVSGTAPTTVTTPTQCCGYGSAGEGSLGYDCLIIPGAYNPVSTESTKHHYAHQLCGRSQGLPGATTDPSLGNTICSTRTPFQIRFVSDKYEWQAEALSDVLLPDLGFQLAFIQSNNNCDVERNLIAARARQNSQTQKSKKSEKREANKAKKDAKKAANKARKQAKKQKQTEQAVPAEQA